MCSVTCDRGPDGPIAVLAAQRYPPHMLRYTRSGQAHGSRDDVVRALRNAVDGWLAMGRPDLSRQAQQAADAISAGAQTADVGHLTYVVRE